MSTYSSFLKQFFWRSLFTCQYPFYFSKVTNLRSADIDDKSSHLDDDFLPFWFVMTFIEIAFISYTIIFYQSNVDIESVELLGSFQNLSKYDVKLIKNIFQFSTLLFLDYLISITLTFVAVRSFSQFSAKSEVKE